MRALAPGPTNVAENDLTHVFADVHSLGCWSSTRIFRILFFPFRKHLTHPSAIFLGLQNYQNGSPKSKEGEERIEERILRSKTAGPSSGALARTSRGRGYITVF